MFPVILDAIILVLAAWLLVPVAVLIIEVGAALFGRVASAPAGTRAPLAILVPAHNEECGISDTLRCIVTQLAERDRLVVVADNCTDGTSAMAKAEGAEVITRTNKDQRGKGFALDFGLRHLEPNPPDVVIIVDADCQVAPGAIDRLARVCVGYRRPVQALYLMRSPSSRQLGMQIAEFAWAVKNRVRPTGLARLGLPCQLMGSGMAFPWRDIADMNLADGHIVEDMKMGLELARSGSPPVFCSDALVMSVFPTHQEGVKTQRTRWEHGHLGMILSEAPALFFQGLCQMKMSLVALALDLCVPPLALLAMQISVVWLFSAVLHATTGFSAPLWIMSSAGISFALTVLAAWAGYGRSIISFPRLMSAFVYPLAKIPMYVQFIFSRQSEWVRSKRDRDR